MRTSFLHLSNNFFEFIHIVDKEKNLKNIAQIGTKTDIVVGIIAVKGVENIEVVVEVMAETTVNVIDIVVVEALKGDHGIKGTIATVVLIRLDIKDTSIECEVVAVVVAIARIVIIGAEPATVDLVDEAVKV